MAESQSSSDNQTLGISENPKGLTADVLLIEDLGQQRLTARLLHAILKREGIAAHLADFPGRYDIPRVVQLALQFKPRLVLLSIIFANRLEEHNALVEALGSAGVNAHITLAGHLPAISPRLFLDACPALDSVLCAEAEALIVPLAQTLLAGNSPASLPGLFTRESVMPLYGPRITDLDLLPFPSYDDGIPFHPSPPSLLGKGAGELGAAKQAGGLGYGFCTVEASRGCFHACAFCIPSAFYRHAGLRYRQKSIPRLVDEIESLYRRGARLFLFDDEQFLPPKNVTSSLCEGARPTLDYIDALGQELAHRQLEIAFTCKCRADDVDPVLFSRLQSIGLIRVYVGIESGSALSLAYFGKGTTPDQNLSALQTLSELGLVADFRTLILHPASSWESIEQDLDFSATALPSLSTVLTFCEAGIYPGTPLAARLRIPPDTIPTYSLADPGLELLRRLNRLVFGPNSRLAALADTVTEAWFDHLLARRFGTVDGSEKAEFLLQIVREANRASLEVWREMLEWVRHADLGDAAAANRLAGDWACRVNAGSEELLEHLEEL